MEIKDLQGKTIKVTDIEGSIAMVAEFMEYSHTDADLNLQRFDKQRQAYWKDIYDKLLSLKAETGNGNNNENSTNL